MPYRTNRYFVDDRGIVTKIERADQAMQPLDRYRLDDALDRAWRSTWRHEKMIVEYPHITVKLIGKDSDASSILRRVKKAMTQGGVPQDEIDFFMHCASYGDYDNLLVTVMKTVTVE